MEGTPRESARRSFVKALSWRMIGTLDTFVLSFLLIKFVGPYFGVDPDMDNKDMAMTAGGIAIAEVVTKIIIYTVHERFWNHISWGVIADAGKRKESKSRSVAKTATWRMIASLDTTLLAFLFIGNVSTAFSIGSLEVLTKLVLYFFHERVWQRIHFV